MDYNYILTSDGELYHYGVKGMKWGVRRTKKTSSQEDERKFTKKSLTTGQKVAIGAAATAAVLATAWGGYTVAKAYGREMSRIKNNAKRTAVNLATATEFERKYLGAKKFDVKKYKDNYKHFVSQDRKRLLKKDNARYHLQREIEKQGRLVTSVAGSIRQRVAPSPFDLGNPKSLREILDDYNKHF